MQRRQLLEIEDQPWCPAAIRNAVTDYLQFLIEFAQPYAVAPLLRTALNQAGERRILDLASGAGGPWRHLRQQLEQSGVTVSVLLSDKYPNNAATERLVRSGAEEIRYLSEPIDATSVPAELPGFRTLFSSFHHFSPAEARAVLQDAVAQNRGIGVFEALERSPRYMVLACLNGLLIFILTPCIRPFGWSRLLWTYLLPAVPLILILDGLVSCLRAYTPDELRELASSVRGSGYTWEVGTARGRSWPLPVTYLLGYPVAADSLELAN